MNSKLDVIHEVIDVAKAMSGAAFEYEIESSRIEFAINGRRCCTVYLPSTRYGEPFPPMVNWTAQGETSVKETLAFAKVLQAAAFVAEGLRGLDE